MKKVELERQAIVRALDSAPNITVAAKNLGAARRTLQARMRDYNIPKGQSGRPRELLPYKHMSVATWAVLGVLIGVGGAVGLGVYLARRKDSTAVAGVRMVGLDLLGATK